MFHYLFGLNSVIYYLVNLRRFSHCLRYFMATSFNFCYHTKGKVVMMDELGSTDLQAMKPVVCVCVCARARWRICVCMWYEICFCKFSRDLLGQPLLKSIWYDVTLADISQTLEERFQCGHLVLTSRFNYTVKTVWFQDSMCKSRYIWKRRRLFYFPLK